VHLGLDHDAAAEGLGGGARGLRALGEQPFGNRDAVAREDFFALVFEPYYRLPMVAPRPENRAKIEKVLSALGLVAPVGAAAN
jgi:hypothetical protein